MACGVDETTTDGPLEVSIDVAEEFDDAPLRVGVFSTWNRAALSSSTDTVWVDDLRLRYSLVTHTVHLAERFSEDRIIGVEPVGPMAVQRGDLVDVELPRSATPGTTHLVLAWVDANDNGLLDLADDDDASELSIAPRKQISEQMHTIVSVRRRADDNVRFAEGEFRITAQRDGFDLFGVELRDEDLGGWQVTLEPR